MTRTRPALGAAITLLLLTCSAMAQSSDGELRLGVNTKTALPGQPSTDSTFIRREAESLRTNASRIELDLQPGQTVRDAWDDYFVALKDAPPAEQHTARARIRETVRYLMNRATRNLEVAEKHKKAIEQYQEVISLVDAALRHGFPQTWMYEAMALAMKATEAPDEEVERVLMSAVDFASSPDDVLIVAEHMTHLDLDRRALQLFRNVADVQPFRPEPYVRGLAVAQDLEDIEGIKWACLGILRQAWTNREKHIERKAYDVARATYDKLITEDDPDEAEAFKRQVNQALKRDCVVRVTWTGKADIDLLVEEPNGSVCSLHNPRTTGGGVLLADNWARLGGSTPDGYSECYVCPLGFSGRYRMLLRRVWGKPTAGKVTVDVVTNYGSGKQTSLRKQVTLGDNAIGDFQLEHGRRKDPLDAQQIVNVARCQEAIARAVLSQQLAAYENSDAVTDYLRAALQAQQDGRLPRRRNVGVRPQITTLPEGTNLSASAVISADRRYVRVTPMPLFSGIGEVTTFTFTGDTTGLGTGTGTGTGTGISDKRLKTNIKPLEYGLDEIRRLSPVRFNWMSHVDLRLAGSNGETMETIYPSSLLGHEHEVGLVAQEVEALIPEVIASDAAGIKAIHYHKLVPVLIRAVQELADENERLRSNVSKLKARLDNAAM